MGMEPLTPTLALPRRGGGKKRAGASPEHCMTLSVAFAMPPLHLLYNPPLRLDVVILPQAT